MGKKFVDLANLKSNLENFFSEIISPTFATKEDMTKQLGSHTVKSDVPENAVFTDTVYDDTGVKEEIDDINSNLDNLKVSDIAGGKNLVNISNTRTNSFNGVTITKSKNCLILNGTSSDIVDIYVDNETIDNINSEYGTYVLSNNLGLINYFSTTSGFLTNKVTTSESNKVLNIFLRIDSGKTFNNDVLEAQLEKGSTATPYEPCIPSVKMLAEDVDTLKNDLSASNAGAHNSVYRGKYLGDSLTTEQKAQISAGTFNDLYIGDYWTIGGVNYRIAAFDYWLNSGDTNCTTHHIVIVPDSNLYTANMTDTNITTGAYIGSDMYKTNLAQAKTTINNAFGSANILSHREYLANATKSTTDPTYESAASWYDSSVELMNERMVYGADIFHNIEVNGAIPTNYTIDKSQLPLFALEPSRICNHADWWLRDVVSATYFARVAKSGSAATGDPSDYFGVRPAFAIKGQRRK